MWPVGELLCYFILPLWLGNSEATGKKTVDRITRTEGEQLTDVMTCVESLIRSELLSSDLIND